MPEYAIFINDPPLSNKVLVVQAGKLFGELTTLGFSADDVNNLIYVIDC